MLFSPDRKSNLGEDGYTRLDGSRLRRQSLCPDGVEMTLPGKGLLLTLSQKDSNSTYHTCHVIRRRMEYPDPSLYQSSCLATGVHTLDLTMVVVEVVGLIQARYYHVAKVAAEVRRSNTMSEPENTGFFVSCRFYEVNFRISSKTLL